jgi:hypothetical protein
MMQYGEPEAPHDEPSARSLGRSGALCQTLSRAHASACGASSLSKRCPSPHQKAMSIAIIPYIQVSVRMNTAG